MLFIGLIVVMCVSGCLYSDKPSEEVIKDTIINYITDKNNKNIELGKGYVKYGKFNTFQVTNSFSKSINGETIYYIEVSYDVESKSMHYETNKQPWSHEGMYHMEFEKYSFVKKGNKWYGNIGWGN